MKSVSGMATPKYLIIPDNRWKDVETLLSLSASQMQVVAETLRSKETLKAEQRSYQIVAKKADIGQSEAIAVLSVVTNLISQRHRYSLSDEQLLADLNAVSSGKFESRSPNTRDALLELLSESEEGSFVEKAESLKIGFSPHFVSMRSVFDVRVMFDEDHEKIEGGLLVTYLEITVCDEECGSKTFVLQLTHSDMRKMRECLDDAEKKLKVMEEEFGEKWEFFF